MNIWPIVLLAVSVKAAAVPQYGSYGYQYVYNPRPTYVYRNPSPSPRRARFNSFAQIGVRAAAPPGAVPIPLPGPIPGYAMKIIDAVFFFLSNKVEQLNKIDIYLFILKII